MASEQPDSIGDLAHRYLRAVDEAEAQKESFLAGCAEDYYEPGFLSDDEWELLKDCVNASNYDDAMVVVEVAIHRKVATEEGREDEFDREWPAKGGGRR